MLKSESYCPRGSIYPLGGPAVHNLLAVGPQIIGIVTNISAHAGLPRVSGSLNFAIRRRIARNSLRGTATSAS